MDFSNTRHLKLFNLSQKNQKVLMQTLELQQMLFKLEQADFTILRK